MTASLMLLLNMIDTNLKQSICVIKGSDSLLLVLPLDAATALNIGNHETLNYEVKNRQLVICKNHESETFSDRGVGK